MQTFINDDFLLQSEPARILYHDYAEQMPIFDYHCHLNPREICENARFDDLAHAWLGGDHYKWRVMRACGVEERFITGDASGREKFDRYAAVMPQLIGNPIYHWSHLELIRYFGIDTLLAPDTADAIWQTANAKLQSPDGAARSLIEQSNVRALCTTDDPIDDLRWHKALAADVSFSVRVLPSFRPDKALHIEQDGFVDYLHALGSCTGLTISSLDDVRAALSARLDYFVAAGCRVSDHSFGSPDFTVWDESAAEEALHKALAGEPLIDYEVAAYQSALMDFLGEAYADRGLIMQLHFGAIRNLNRRLFRTLGPDVGGDAIGDPIPADSLAALLGRLDSRGKLGKTVLYTLNAADNDKLIAAAGCFQDAAAPGKIQFGSAWWFNDHFYGMEQQMKSLASIGVLSRFVGMLTDSRSFLSYPRHEYFRRILCNLIGSWVAAGHAPADYTLLGGMVQDICFRNAAAYLGLPELTAGL